MRKPIRYEHDAHVLVSDTNKDDLLNYREAMEDLAKDKLKNIMD